MQIAIGLNAPIKADSVMSPNVHYGDPVTGIFFVTDDNQYGRITFENLDSIKVSRGEYLPFKDDWKEGEPFYWVSVIENSEWLKERYKYEKENYGSSYEFCGNVDDMLYDFKHYIFSFHDEFVEVLARGVWFEKDKNDLFNRELLMSHPSLPLPIDHVSRFEAHGLTCQVRKNQNDIEELINNSIFYSQKLIEFALELEGNVSVSNTLEISYRNEKLVSTLRDYFGGEVMRFDGIASLDEVKSYIESDMKEVAERRKQTRKQLRYCNFKNT